MYCNLSDTTTEYVPFCVVDCSVTLECALKKLAINCVCFSVLCYYADLSALFMAGARSLNNYILYGNLHRLHN